MTFMVMNRRKKTSLGVIIFILAIGVGCFVYLRNKVVVQPLALGQQVPPVLLQTIDGKEVSTRSLITRKSIVVFFSPNCSHCRDEMKELAQLYPDIKDSITVVAVSTSNGEATKRLVRTIKIPFPVYLDLKSEGARAFHVLPVPVLFCFSREQRLLRFKAGEQSEEQLKMFLMRFKNWPQDSTLAKI